MPGNIVELEFEMGETDLLLVRASEEASCSLQLEEIRHRSDGTGLEFVTADGTDPGRLLEFVRTSDDLIEARLLSEDEHGGLFEFVTKSPTATALADDAARFTGFTATVGDGRITAEVPPHVEASTVIDSFLDQYPKAELVARRETDRESPTLTENQLHDKLVSDLTDRQLQALQTAYSRGYFDWPRESTTEDVASELGVATSTFSQHLRLAEGKLLKELFAE